MPGDMGRVSSRRPRFSARRRLLLLVCLAVLVGAALVANYGPITDYREARARLERTTAEVAALEAQQATLQAELGKLSEAGYLESLAREQLTYTRPGEELYIVSGPGEAEAAASAAAGPGLGLGATVGAAGSTAGGSATAGGEAAGPAEEPGLLERILSAIGGWF